MSKFRILLVCQLFFISIVTKYLTGRIKGVHLFGFITQGISDYRGGEVTGTEEDQSMAIWLLTLLWQKGSRELGPE